MITLSGRLRPLVAAAGLACAAVLVTAPSASAVAYEKTMKTDDGDPGGIIKFAANGDYVEVCDIEADGYAVRGTVNDGAGHLYSLTAGGNGKCSVTSAAVSAHNLKEYECVYFSVILYNGNGDNSPTFDSSYWYNGGTAAVDCEPS